MINLITNEDYFAIYSFTDSVSSLIGVKEYLKNQFPKRVTMDIRYLAITQSFGILS